jgi:hypothetical protein
MKTPVSVTLADDNLLWLKGQAAATTRGNVSEVLDRLIQKARTGGAQEIAVRSVAGTIDLPADALDESGLHMRDLFERSIRRPLTLGEPLLRSRPRGKRG